MSIRYYSTNRNLKNVAGITPFTGKVSFKEALLKGQERELDFEDEVLDA